MKALLAFALLVSSSAAVADCKVKAAGSPAQTVAPTAASMGAGSTVSRAGAKRGATDAEARDECLVYSYDVAVVSNGSVRSVLAGAITGRIVQTEPRAPNPAELEKLAIR